MTKIWVKDDLGYGVQVEVKNKLTPSPNTQSKCQCVCHSDKPHLSPHTSDRCLCNKGNNTQSKEVEMDNMTIEEWKVWHDLLELMEQEFSIKHWAYNKSRKMYNAILSSTRQQVQEEMVASSYKKGLDDMFLEIAKLAEPDERQPSAGDLHTNLDNIHEIRNKLLSLLKETTK